MKLLLCVAAILVASTFMTGVTYAELITIEDPEAKCLDGSPYKFYIWPGDSSEWSIGIRGGGWCLTEESCKERALTALGSSKGYNSTGTWGPTEDNVNGAPTESTCQGINNNCTRVYMPYCDGSCFTSQNASSEAMNLYFRGRAILESTIDMLENRFDFAKAKKVVVYGGSAGGLSTFLHVDYVSKRLEAAAAAKENQVNANAINVDQTSQPMVVGRPVAGYFISEENFNPSIPSYAEQVKYGVEMFNATSFLNRKCMDNYPGEEWKCFMAPYVAPFVNQRLFIVQSRFDEFQLMELLGLPCLAHQSYVPPFSRSTCNATERMKIKSFGAQLYKSITSYISEKPENGLWLVSCIQHNVVCDLDNTKESLAFQSWLTGGELGKTKNYRWVDDCGLNGDTPCNTGKMCAPPHFSDTSAVTGDKSDVVVFRHGESGYPCIRTPAVIKTKTALLAFAGTRCGNGDGCNPFTTTTVDHMDTVMKRSTDNGLTWSNISVLYSASCQDRDHGTPVYDRVKDRVVLVFRGKDLLTWTMYSDDDGASWSEPSQINLDRYNTSRVSPGRGLQLSSTNKYAPNRLVFVAQFGVKGRSVDIVYYSDDHGISWTRSKTIIAEGNEAQIVELANSTLLMNARVEVRSEETSRLFARSDDGGATWSSFTLRHDIAATSCMGSTIAVPADGKDEKQVLLYSHPASGGKQGSKHRSDGTVWISTDEANSWNPFFHATEKTVGFAYSCLTETFVPKTIGLLYETEDASSCKGPSCKILFTRFDLPT